MTNPAIQIDTTNMYSDVVGNEGVSQSDLQKVNQSCASVHDELTRKILGGLEAEFACLNLHELMQNSLADIHAAATEFQRYSDVIVVGIGGSSLGAKAVYEATAGNNRQTNTRLHFVENVDPYSLHQQLSRIDPSRCGVLCISKSGGTIETVVQYLILRDWLVRGVGQAAARAQQLIITDPVSGWMRELVRAERLASLPVPPRVGGRFSVFSAVGLLPLAIAGIDIEVLLEGAAASAARCCGHFPDGDNPALEIATVCCLLDTRHDKHISVMMPYANRMQLFVDWYRQLWAESLGKWNRERPDARPAGTLPVRSMGAVDQHSQLQMYIESRHDKFFTFIELGHWQHDLKVPLSDSDASAFPFLRNKSMADVIGAELKATRDVITSAGHPNMSIRLPALDAHVLGQLIDLYQRATVYAGLLYRVNPLDQPSVEQGKLRAIEYLSRSG